LPWGGGGLLSAVACDVLAGLGFTAAARVLVPFALRVGPLPVTHAELGPQVLYLCRVPSQGPYPGPQRPQLPLGKTGPELPPVALPGELGAVHQDVDARRARAAEDAERFGGVVVPAHRAVL